MTDLGQIVLFKMVETLYDISINNCGIIKINEVLLKLLVHN